MTDASPDLSLAERIDAICDQFEQDFRAGKQPAIESCLGGSQEPFRTTLLRAVVGLEIELRQQRGEKPQPEEYIPRFPGHAAAIQQVFTEINSNQSSVKVSAAETSKSQSSASPVAATNSQLLQTLGRFQILSVLGEGAFGTVYKAHDPQLDRDVAIKVPRSGTLLSQEDRERFLREARAAAGLQHALICPVYEVGTIDGRDYIVMAFIDGKPLSKVMQTQSKLSDKQVVVVIRKLALALQEAHEKGIIHRDLKPANIMINRKGEPVIMDFGLARRSNSADAQISHSGQIMGTPAYMSPEQARGDGKVVGPAADVYSLGIIFYELLCGRRPFDGTITEVIGKILHVEAEPPSKYRAGVDARLETICRKAIAKQLPQRFASMKEFAASLGDYLKEPEKPAASVVVTETKHPVQTAAAVSVSITDQQRNIQQFITQGQLPAALEALKPLLSKPDPQLADWAKQQTAKVKADIKKWQEQLPTLTALGHKLIRKCDYAEAKNILSQIPAGMRPAEIQEALQEAEDKQEECDLLQVEIDEALRKERPKELPSLVKRFLQLKPGHKAMQKLAEDLKQYGAERAIKIRKGEKSFDAAGAIWDWKILAAVACGFAVLFAGVYFAVIAFSTPQGTVIINVHDKNVAVTFANDEITIDSSGKKYTLKPTDKKTLKIIVDGIEIESATQEITVTKNEEKQITAKLVSGNLELSGIGETKKFAVRGSDGELSASPPASRSPAADLARWQGRWQCVSENSWGKVVYNNDQTGVGPVQIISGNTRELNKISRDNKTLVGKSQFRIDDSVSPKTFDCDEFSFEDGKFRQSGIYEFAGERLRVVYRFAKNNQPARATWNDIGQLDVHYYEFERVSAVGEKIPADAITFNGHAYKFFPQTLSWTEAKQRCEQMGGHLPIVDSKEENDFLVKLCEGKFPKSDKIGGPTIWLGATDFVEEGKWMRIDGKPMTYSNWYKAGNQPNNGGNNANEHYATMLLIDMPSLSPDTKAGQWSDQPDVPTQQDIYLVCEWDTANADRTVAEWVLSNGGKVAVLFGDKYVRDITKVMDLPTGSITLVEVDQENDNRLTAAGLEHLGAASNLTGLVLAYANVSDDDLAKIKTLNKLFYLGLSGNNLTNSGLEHLQTLTNIGTLGLNNHPNVGDAGLANLKNLIKLEFLYLFDTGVSDVGLKHLYELRGLKHVNLERTKVTAEGMAALHQALPGCQIVWNGGTIEPTISPAAWTELFNGQNLSNWTDRDGKPAAWKVENGYMEVTPNTKDIVTRDNFPLDFELHVEFWVPKDPTHQDQGRGNSGVYLHGRHEVQICDGYQNPIKEPKTACGALYGALAPSQNVCKPPETWQEFDITYRSPRVDAQQKITAKGRLTVIHNGTKIIDNGEFEKNGGLNQNENHGQPGPIMLQNHGTPVRFRSVRIRPLGATTAAANIPADAQTFNGHAYKFFAEQLSWKAAKAKCEALGGHLIIVDNAEENAFAAKLVEAAKWEDAWIGATDQDKEGDWRTVQGGPLTYTNWYPSQPNNKPPGEHWALMSNRKFGDEILGWKWSDQPDDSTQHKPGYLCEWDVVTNTQAAAADWTDLFNGVSLQGWNGDPRFWRVENGAIVGESTAAKPAKTNTCLVWNGGEVADFEFQCEYKIDSGNSGIHYRSYRLNPKQEPWTLAGYQADIDGRPQGEFMGIVYEEKGRGILSPKGKRTTIGGDGKPRATEDLTGGGQFPAREWNEYRVVARGFQITQMINGVTTAELIDEDAKNRRASGVLAFQLHAGQSMKVQFRNVRIRQMN